MKRLALCVRGFYTCSQKGDCPFSDCIDRLRYDGQSGMEKARPFEVVKAHYGDITGNVQSGRVQVLHQSHHRSIVPRENCSGRTLQRQEPVKRLPVLASVMNQCFVNRKTMTLKSLL